MKVIKNLLKKHLTDIPIQRKLIIISLVSAGISLFFAGIIIVVVEYFSYRQSYIDESMLQTRIIGYNCSAALLFYDRKTAESNLSALKNNPKAVYGAIYNNDGTLLADYRKTGTQSGPSLSLSGNEVYSFDIRYLTVIQPVIFDNEVIGKIVVRSELKHLYMNLLSQIMLFVMVIVGAFLLIFILTSKLQIIITKPIDELVELMKKISQNKIYTMHAVVHGKDELGELACGFNEMLTQIRERDSELEKYSRYLEEIVEERTSRLRLSLKEKEVLLKEIHHRVKNNMQVISSLLNLQAANVEEKHLEEMLKDSINRIKSMALIHEKLYQSKDLANVNFVEYITGLTENLLSSHKTQRGNIFINLDIEDIFLRINTAIPCGLIINELVSNSLKHAFPEERKGQITISFHKDESAVAGDNTQGTIYALKIRDDGAGFPADFDIYSIKTLGLRLVQGLIQQISGSLELNTENGTEFCITFKTYLKRGH